MDKDKPMSVLTITNYGGRDFVFKGENPIGPVQEFKTNPKRMQILERNIGNISGEALRLSTSKYIEEKLGVKLNITPAKVDITKPNPMQAQQMQPQAIRQPIADREM